MCQMQTVLWRGVVAKHGAGGEVCLFMLYLFTDLIFTFEFVQIFTEVRAKIFSHG